MGKFKSWKHRNLFTSIAVPTCLVGATAGLIFGVSAGTFKINYVDLKNSAKRAAAANSTFNYYSQNIKSAWNMTSGWNPNSMHVKATDGVTGPVHEPWSKWEADGDWWKALHNNADYLTSLDLVNKLEMRKEYGTEDITDSAKQARYDYMSMVIDGSTHSTMDRSFNQGLYNGVVNFINNHDVPSSKISPENGSALSNSARSYKPGGDSTTSFKEIYASVAANSRAVGLAGFNHVTPLNALGVYGNGKTGDEFDGGKATNYRFAYENAVYDSTGFLLIDGEVANNQNIASVLFRSDEPGFLVGLATPMYFLNNLHTYHDKHQTLSIGIFGGTPIPTVTIYLGGIQRGVEFFNEFALKQGIVKDGIDELKTSWQIKDKMFEKLYQHSKYKDLMDSIITGKKEDQLQDLANKLVDEYSVRIIKLGDTSTHFSGTFSAGDAIGITKQYLNRGASAIVAVAGPQSLDSAQEILNQRSKCIVVGVDSAMEEGDYQKPQAKESYKDVSVAPDGSKPAQANKTIKFSAVKDMTTVTNKFAQLCASGRNFDVLSENKWEHDQEPEAVGVDQQSASIIPDSAYKFKDSTDGVSITGLDLDQIKPEHTILRIPEKLSGKPVKAISTGAFKNTDGKLDNIKHILFNTQTEMTIWDSAFEGLGNVQIIDFRNVDGDVNYIVWPNAFKGLPTTKQGFLCMNNKSSDASKSLLVRALNDGDLPGEWYVEAPDPEKSICGIGYKTCGNIKNGLISISFDGWAPLMQALSYVKFVSFDPMRPEPQPFDRAWLGAVLAYSAYDPIVPEEILEQWRTLDNVITYNPDSSVKKYYPEIIKILSYALDSIYLQIPASMNIKDSGQKDKNGNTIWVEETETKEMTILEWLRQNMYLAY